MSPSLDPKSGLSAFIFGPQAMSFGDEAFRDLHARLVKGGRHRWAFDAVATLPEEWRTISQSVTILHQYDGAKLLDHLNHWLETGEAPKSAFPLQNVLLAPLVVIDHITSYMDFIKAAVPELQDHDALLSLSKRSLETLGLSLGTLAAFAVSSSTTLSELRKNAAVALRLAMLVGSVADAEDISHNLEERAMSLSAFWKSEKLHSNMLDILSTTPDAYISVAVDEKRATITTSKSKSIHLMQQLRAAGLYLAEVSIRGRFHWSGHQGALQELTNYCDQNSNFQFPDSSTMLFPTRSITGAQCITDGSLHEIALRAILVDLSLWHETISNAYGPESAGNLTSVTLFGPERCVPPALTRQLGSKLSHILDIDLKNSHLPKEVFQSSRADGTTKPVVVIQQANSQQANHNETSPDKRIAIIGMSCNFPGGEDMDEFWQTLVSGMSQHEELPKGRFQFETPWRETNTKEKWYGNFIKDYDAFDHKFFKKGPREALNSDPQHRLLLHAAYQALEQTGYFSKTGFDKHIACYIAPGNQEYASNAICYPSNAYTATGNLKSMCAGKISHHFGFTGPMLTIDTACSGSCVAIHLACRSILSGEVTGALAGGCNILSGIDWYDNLTGAHFLSPTGQCKPFDASADGYCRGDGIGLVFLKKLSTAIADGDQVYGVIAGSKVYQNVGSSSITVPNADSLVHLFEDMIEDAHIDPTRVSVVEAHGTGTPVGDPVEYDAICRIFGGSQRTEALSLSSIKGLIGHTESASGVASVLKVLMMMREGAIPPQASYNSLNPAIKTTSEDSIDVLTSLTPWKSKERIAVVNNYGASGSNASLVMTEAPASDAVFWDVLLGKEFPFWIAGLDSDSIQRYAKKLLGWIQQNDSSEKALSVRNLSFQVAFQSNRDLPQGYVFKASSTSDLVAKLAAVEQRKEISVRVPPRRPVIFCFGGQISTFIGLDKEFYENSGIFRKFLDQCDAACISLSFPSIFPHIFQKTPLSNIVSLQLSLFAMQYSCAKAWMACGAEPAALVGHSFGELTASSISGAVSLHDAIKMVAGRAALIEKKWGTDCGAMMAVDADLSAVEELLTKSREASGSSKDPSIACYNGPRSFTLAGTTKAIDLAESISKTDPAFSILRSKKLKVTNAFHSVLVDDLSNELQNLGKSIVFHDPKIRLERATKDISPEKLDSGYLAYHMRSPVYFDHALRRLSKDFPAAIWLEAGSNSTITAMASKALNSSASPSSFHFQGVSITTESAFDLLVDSTIRLWKEGLNVTFWTHHRSQTHQYSPLILPPYQFEKSRHWLEQKAPPKVKAAIVNEPTPALAEPPKDFTTFAGYLDDSNRILRFQINTTNEVFHRHINGHVLANTAATWPCSIQMDMAIDVLMNLRPEFKDLTYQPEVRNILHHQQLLLDPSKIYWLDLEPKDEDGLSWEWKINATNRSVSNLTLYTSGSCSFRPANDTKCLAEFETLERLSNRRRCVELLEAKDVDNVMQGANIYRAFSEIIEYTDDYKHIKKLVGHNNESAAKILKTHHGKTWLDYLLFDSLAQTAGMYVNLMSLGANTSERVIFMCESIDRWFRSPKLQTHESLPGNWEVYAVHHPVAVQKYVSDIFVFDARDGSLIEVILGVSYNKVPLQIMRGLLGDQARTIEPPAAMIAQPSSQEPLVQFKPLKPLLSRENDIETSRGPEKTRSLEKPHKKVKKPSRASDTAAKTRTILENLTGVGADSINDSSNLIDIGLDSLLGMELSRDVEEMFQTKLDMDRMMELKDFTSLVAYIDEIRGTTGQEVDGAETDEEPDRDEDVLTPETDSSIQGGVNDSLNGKAMMNGTSDSQIQEVMSSEDTALSPATVLDAFRSIKKATDDFVLENSFDTYCKEFMPRAEELSIAIFCNAFEELGCPIRSAAPGTKLKRIEHIPKHKKFVDYMYKALEKNSGLIETHDGELSRTAVPCPSSDTATLLHDLLRDRPEQDAELKLMRITSGSFAKCLAGKADALPLLFGSAEGRDLLTKMYATSTMSSTILVQLAAFIEKIGSTWPKDAGPLRILEVGAGTGGTTFKIAPVLAGLGIPVIYTFTDVSSFFVATARGKLKQYPFLEFKVVDIEKEPDAKLLHTQHIVLGSNVIHATRKLPVTLSNIHKMLRPDGFTIFHELTTQLLWADVIFGLVEGWWLFEDGRDYALQSPQHWKKVLKSVGFGYVDWTDGQRPESKVQNLIFALASDPQRDLTKPPAMPDVEDQSTAIDSYVREFSKDFNFARSSVAASNRVSLKRCVLVTGATGSLGAHLAAYCAGRIDIATVICFNRTSQSEPHKRQEKAFDTKGVLLDEIARSKLQIIETDASKPMLGLHSDVYASLVDSVTDIIHNAWPISFNRGVRRFESQFKIMRNLIDLARAATTGRPQSFKFGFQFVSSIAVVGMYPILTGNTLVPEDHMPIEAVAPSGYGYAKLVCERMLDETLHKFPQDFRPLVVRVNQVSGSTRSGYWNKDEAVVLLIKSSQTLNALPDLDGHLSWCPVDTVAAALGEILLDINENTPTPPTYPIYHIENPARQSCSEMTHMLSDALGVPHIIPFKDWVKRVQDFQGSMTENPAKQVMEFFAGGYFERIGCGGLVFDTAKSQELSPTLRASGVISPELLNKYIEAWKKSGFLN